MLDSISNSLLGLSNTAISLENHVRKVKRELHGLLTDKSAISRVPCRTLKIIINVVFFDRRNNTPTVLPLEVPVAPVQNQPVQLHPPFFSYCKITTGVEKYENKDIVVLHIAPRNEDHHKIFKKVLDLDHFLFRIPENVMVPSNMIHFDINICENFSISFP